MPIRGERNAMPSKGGPQQNIFSRNGSQANPPLGSGFKPNIVASSKKRDMIKPKKRDNMLKKS